MLADFIYNLYVKYDRFFFDEEGEGEPIKIVFPTFLATAFISVLTVFS